MKQITTPTYKVSIKNRLHHMKHLLDHKWNLQLYLQYTILHYSGCFRWIWKVSIRRLFLRLKKTHFPDKGRDRLTTDSFIRIWILKLETETWNWNWNGNLNLKRKLETETWNGNLKWKLEMETCNWILKLKLEIKS